ncbi:MAG: DUF2764 family protein [Treponema sp.]|uniref:DUF2764 family protein n=1 Tax=Treponema sp. TaxID=166 RepID=UPI00257EEFA4|nr:DUF2764 family protein [Treponema sp.]MBQ9102541.1 DUF2764 family protein [Treponema sp.]
MSNQYYLLAQLPSFSVTDEKSVLPVTEEYFYDLCSRFLDKKSFEQVKLLSLTPPLKKVSTGSVFLDKWYDSERNLRFALAQIRALRMNKKFEIENESFSPDVIQAARTATGMDSPLAAEQFLNQYRLNLLDNIRPADEFSVDAVYAYGLRLKLALRMKMFNAEKGMVSYHKIYDSILKGDMGDK